MDLVFKKFDQDLLDKTKEVWGQQIEQYQDDIYAPSYQQKLDWADKRLHDDTGTLHVYALVDEAKPDHAVAIIELNHAMPKGNEPWLKMMSVTLQPMYDSVLELVELKDLAKISARCITESYALIFEEHPSAILKVIGNNTLTIDFLRFVATTLQDSNIKAKTQGQWLVIEKCDPSLLT